MAKTWQKPVKKVLKDRLRVWDNNAMIIAHPIAHPQVSRSFGRPPHFTLLTESGPNSEERFVSKGG
jgi:hypothetical protein